MRKSIWPNLGSLEHGMQLTGQLIMHLKFLGHWNMVSFVETYAGDNIPWPVQRCGDFVPRRMADEEVNQHFRLVAITPYK